MFLKSTSNKTRNIRANDIASSVMTIAFFVYITFLSLNVMFQSFTKMRMVTAVDVATSYLASHPDGGATTAQVTSIMNHYIDSSFIKTTTNTSVNWGYESAGCVSGSPGSCHETLTDPAAGYGYRKPFNVIATFDIPAIINIPMLPDLGSIVINGYGTMEVASP